MATLLFDARCPLCRDLAAIVVARSQGQLQAAAWQDQAGAETRLGPEDIVLVTAHERWEGPAAWEELLARHPDLRPWHWLAERCGLVRPAAQALRAGARIMKLFCQRCGKRV